MELRFHFLDVCLKKQRNKLCSKVKKSAIWGSWTVCLKNLTLIVKKKIAFGFFRAGWFQRAYRAIFVAPLQHTCLTFARHLHQKLFYSYLSNKIKYPAIPYCNIFPFLEHCTMQQLNRSLNSKETFVKICMDWCLIRTSQVYNYSDFVAVWPLNGINDNI